MSLRLDHLAIAATDLAQGAAAVEHVLGVPLEPGGRHPEFGTHNRLLSLGPGEYLEVIAPDPDAPPPGRPRWFSLDAFAGPPALRTWIVRTDDMAAARARLGEEIGVPMTLARGAYRWTMAVPPDGDLPYDLSHPAVLQWHGPQPPAALPDRGCRLLSLEVSHPEAAALQARLAMDDARIAFRVGPPGLSATLATPSGPVALP